MSRLLYPVLTRFTRHQSGINTAVLKIFTPFPLWLAGIKLGVYVSGVFVLGGGVF